MLVSLTLSIPLLWKNTLMKRRGGLAVESVPVRTGKNNILQHIQNYAPETLFLIGDY